MHLGFHNVHGAGARVFYLGNTSEVMQRTEGGEQAVHKAFWDLVTLGIENGWVGHEMTHVAHKEQASAGKREGAAVRGSKSPVGVQASGEARVSFCKGVGQVAFHESQPVPIDHNFILGIHRRDRVLAILNRGEGRL